MKRRLLIIFLFLLIKGYSQKQENEYNKLIDSAISIQVHQLFKLSNSSTVSASNKKALYLIDENDFPYQYKGVPTAIEFKTIDLSRIENRGILKNGIHVWKIIPMLKSNKIVVRIIDFLITYKRSNYNYANGGGSETVFEYLCGENRWELVKTKYQGL